MVESLEQCLWRQESAPRCRQLKGQWQPVQSDADLDYSGSVVLRKDKLGLHHLRTLNEKGDCRILQQLLICWQVERIRQGEWRHRELVFPLHVQDRSAGHQDLDGWTGQEQFNQRGRSWEDLLEIIQQQQEVFVTQERFERLEEQTFLDISETERPCDGWHNQVRVAERSKLHQADTVRKYLDQIRRDFLSQACLADTNGTSEDEKPDLKPSQ